MGLGRHIGLRQRFLWAYTGIVCAAAGAAWLIWPASGGAIAVTLAAGVATAWVLGRWLTWALRRRVRALREATEAASRGELDPRLGAAARDDFVKLAESLDHMADQLRETTRQQRYLQEQLTRSEKLALIGELAAGVAHEINNPLDGLQNGARIVGKYLADIERGERGGIEPMRRMLDLMENGLHRIEMIVRRLLTMSRDEPVNLDATPLNEVVDEASQFVAPRLQQHGVELVTDFPETPVVAHADRVQLVQVLINLMINAADAMPDGGKLVVRCRSAEAGRRAILEVSDTGQGIDPVHLPHVFKPFYTTKARGAGTGLGLSVAQRIIEAHGGRIGLSTEPGRGTRFRIELPAAGQERETGSAGAGDASVPQPHHHVLP